MKTKRCRVCGEVYLERFALGRIEHTGLCTEYAGFNPLCGPDLWPLWQGRRRRLPRALATRFDLPQTFIGELLEYCTEEELVDILSEMENAGTLAAERERLKAEPPAHPEPAVSEGPRRASVHG